jgi:hypothetical protein
MEGSWFKENNAQSIADIITRNGSDADFVEFMGVMRLNATKEPYRTLIPGKRPHDSVNHFVNILGDRLGSIDLEPTPALADRAVDVIMSMRTIKLNNGAPWIAYGDSIRILNADEYEVLQVKSRRTDEVTVYRISMRAADAMRKHIKTKVDAMLNLASFMVDNPVAVAAHLELMHFIASNVDEIAEFDEEAGEATIVHDTSGFVNLTMYSPV